jgi:hypothetical protein
VRGATSMRPPTAAERTGIVGAASRAFHGEDRCVQYKIGISRLDSRYAAVSYVFHEPYVHCLVGNGVSIYVRTRSGWRHVADASSGFSCSQAPPGVVRTLFGDCWTG